MAITQLPPERQSRARAPAGWFKWPTLAFISIILFYVAAVLIWLRLDNTPIEFDQSMYLVRSIRFFHQIQTLQLDQAFNDFWVGMAPLAPYQQVRPVLVPFVAGLGYLVLGGASREIAAATIMGFSLLLLVFVYVIGKNLGGWKTGLLASALTLSLPLMAVLSHQFYTEIPMTAFVAITVYLLMRKDIFSNPLIAAATGAAVGLGMLTRETFPLFVLGPAAAALVMFVRHRRANGEQAITRAMLLCTGIAVFVAIILAGPFYAPKVLQFATFFGGAGNGASGATAEAGLMPFQQWQVYTYMVIRAGVTLPYFLLLVGLAVFAVRRKALFSPPDKGANQRSMAIVIAWLIVPYLITAVIILIGMRYVASRPYDVRLIAAACPAFALILARLIVPIASHFHRFALWPILGIYILAQFLSISFAPGGFRADPFTPWQTIRSELIQGYGLKEKVGHYYSHIPAMAAPQTEDWQVDEIITAVERMKYEDGIKKANIFVIPYNDPVNTGIFVSTAAFYGSTDDYVGPSGLSLEQSRQLMKKCDFVVGSEGAPVENLLAEGLEPIPGRTNELMDTLDEMPEFYRTDQQFLLDNGTKLTIYERR